MSARISGSRAITAAKDLDNHRSVREKMSLGGIRSAGIKVQGNMCRIL